MLRRAWRRALPRALGATLLATLATVGLVAAGRGLQGAHAAGAQQLPNLVADPPNNTEIERNGEEGKTRLLLRFNGYIRNAGPGAVDFRGNREKPKVSKATEELVERARQKQENLPPRVEEELRTPPMKVTQRVFTTGVGLEESNMEREHVEEPSSGQMEYVSADGHHHWHLREIAEYSLWNSAQTAKVAPSQKVGFCLEDSEHVEPLKGPLKEVYGDEIPGEPERAFCKRYQPNAPFVFEGISPGWRDLYRKELALQWVDLSNVLPGQYWLREDIDPKGFVKQTEPNTAPAKHRYATEATVVPGYDAEPVAAPASGGPLTITLKSTRYQYRGEPSSAAEYRIASLPQHGTLGAIHNGSVTYTPNGSYSGPDSFTYVARNPTSEFPEHPAVATVTIEGETPTLSVSGAQQELIVGTSDNLTAVVGHDTGGVEWTASSGSLTPAAGGQSATYVAPSSPGPVTVTARLRDDPEVSAQVAISVIPAPPAPIAPIEPAPPTTGNPSTPPPGSSGGNAGFKAEVKPGVSRPHAMWFARYLVLSTVSSVAGRVRLTAYSGKHSLGTCVTETGPGRSFSCRLKPAASVSHRTRISVLASLRIGTLVVANLLPAARIPEMKMKPAGAGAHSAVAGHVYWCSPSTLVPTLAYGGE